MYVKKLGIPSNVESYILTRVLKKTLVSLEARRSIYNDAGDTGRVDEAVGRLR